MSAAEVVRGPGGVAFVARMGREGPLHELHARTWARGTSPTDDELREVYAAIGFPAAQLERALARKARWHELPEVAVVRFSRPIGGKTDAKISVE